MWFGQPLSNSGNRKLNPAGDSRLRVNPCELVLYGLGPEPQTRRNIIVRAAVDQKLDDLALSRGQEQRPCGPGRLNRRGPDLFVSSRVHTRHNVAAAENVQPCFARTSSLGYCRPEMAAQRQVFIGTDGGATTSKVGAVWEDGTAVSTRLLQRPTGSEHGPYVTVARWVDAIDEYLEGQRPLLEPGRRGRTRDSGAIPALRGSSTIRRTCRRRSSASMSTPPTCRRCPSAPAWPSRWSSGTTATWAGSPKLSGRAATAPGRCDARARLGPGLRLYRPQRAAARRRHDFRHGGGAHAGAAAPARRRALSLRMRADVGVRRGLHDARGLALPAGGGAKRYPDHELARSGGDAKHRSMALRGLAQQNDPLALESSTSRHAHSGCTSPRWRWRSIQPSS